MSKNDAFKKIRRVFAAKLDVRVGEIKKQANQQAHAQAASALATPGHEALVAALLSVTSAKSMGPHLLKQASGQDRYAGARATVRHVISQWVHTGEMGTTVGDITKAEADWRAALKMETEERSVFEAQATTQATAAATESVRGDREASLSLTNAVLYANCFEEYQ